MANNDWDLDDLLDFKFDREIPEKNDEFDIFDELKSMDPPAAPADPAPAKPAKPVKTSKAGERKGLGETFSSYDELKRYEELRKKSDKNAPVSDARDYYSERYGAHSSGYDYASGKYFSRRDDDNDIFAQYDREHRAAEPERKAPVVEAEVSSHHHSVKELEAIKQASQDAYNRYKSNYTRKKKKEAKAAAAGTVTKFDRLLTLIYAAAFVLFLGSMLFMNVLPFGMAAAMFIVLILISLLIYRLTRRSAAKSWPKRLGTLMAVLMIVIYGVGTSYALGTMSFLSGSSVKNESAVSDVTRKPFNFIITGIDVDGTIDEEGRSDVNMVVTVNPSTHQILMTSIPRDYEIYMPDFDNAMDKLTHTGFYGVQTTIGAEENLFDIEINYYVKVNFTTVERFIDAVGGVDVESEYEFTPVKLKDWTVQKGMNHMNGKQALAFARERKAFPTGDNQRIKNQQLVFEALIKKATSSRTMILSYNKVLNSLRNYFEMSFSSREVRKLIRMQLAFNPDWDIYKNTVIGGDGSLPTYSTGGAYAYVMTQDETSIEYAKSLINAVLDGSELTTDEDGLVSIVSE